MCSLARRCHDHAVPPTARAVHISPSRPPRKATFGERHRIVPRECDPTIDEPLLAAKLVEVGVQGRQIQERLRNGIRATGVTEVPTTG